MSVKRPRSLVILGAIGVLLEPALLSAAWSGASYALFLGGLLVAASVVLLFGVAAAWSVWWALRWLGIILVGLPVACVAAFACLLLAYVSMPVG